ncbi:MAG: BON domain-containing protein [Candidatus Woesearchaeota archaeon]
MENTIILFSKGINDMEVIFMPTDEDLKKNIVDQLYWDDRVDASNVMVDVENRIVTLKGTVPSIRAKNAAYNDSLLISGIRMVDDKLDVNYLKGINTGDEDIKRDINDVLLWDPDIDSTKIDVDVLNGIVTLKGSVDSYWKKILAENSTENIIGVRDVINEIAIVPTENWSDEKISENIMNALDRNIYTDPQEVDITVTDGNVDISGKVPNPVVRREVIDVTLFTPGVLAVNDNNLEVATA